MKTGKFSKNIRDLFCYYHFHLPDRAPYNSVYFLDNMFKENLNIVKSEWHLCNHTYKMSFWKKELQLGL